MRQRSLGSGAADWSAAWAGARQGFAWVVSSQYRQPAVIAGWVNRPSTSKRGISRLRCETQRLTSSCTCSEARDAGDSSKTIASQSRMAPQIASA